MNTKRSEIEVGEALQQILLDRPSTTHVEVVNMLAERYKALMYSGAPGVTARMDDVYLAVLRGQHTPLSIDNIRAFPQSVEEWCRRNPMRDDEAHHPVTIHHVRSLDLYGLVKLVDRLERIK